MEIPSGSRGTRATLNIMSRIVRRYKRFVPIRQLALNLVRDLPGQKDFAGQVQRLQRYVRRNIQYVRDVNGVETVQTPERTLASKAGDCDDQSVLLAALLESIGHPTRFVAIRTAPLGPYQHVYTETKIGRRWVPVETTEDWPLGMRPPKVAQRMVVHN